MTSNETIVVVAGLLFGYWIVSNYFNSDDVKDKNNSQNRKKEDSKSYSEKQEQKSSGGFLWYEILGVQETATLDEIADVYKKKIRQYHPDKVESLGPELKKLAELKSKDINAAYNLAKKLRK
jgi:DnaJ-domain-containing protein 1